MPSISPEAMTVEKDVPFTRAEAQRSAAAAPDPWEAELRKMAPGDSFFFADLAPKHMTKVHRIGDRIGIYLISKSVTEPAVGVRTWRRRLDQLPRGRAAKIREKIEEGKFSAEDLSFETPEHTLTEAQRTAYLSTQSADQHSLYWLEPEEDRYYRTSAGDDLKWYYDNCHAISEPEFYDRERYWSVMGGADNDQILRLFATDSIDSGRGAEEDSAMVELCASEYRRLVAARDAGASGEEDIDL